MEIVTTLYFNVLRLRPEEPHGGPGPVCFEQGTCGTLIVCRSWQSAFFPVDELLTLRKLKPFTGTPAWECCPVLRHQLGL